MRDALRRDVWLIFSALTVFLVLVGRAPLVAQSATSPQEIGPEDLRIEQTIEGGYYLFVRAKEGIGSILITESTEAPDRSAATYAYRNPEWHPENGDERRRLDGEFLEIDGVHSLIDSTPVDDDRFGRAYRVFIPYVVIYGYEWTRNGTIQVLDGTYLSVRAFELPYADYEGAFRDNPFILRVTQPVRPPEETGFMPEAAERFREIAQETGGTATRTQTPEEALVVLADRLREAGGRSLDLVVAIDTTQSMRDNVTYLQRELVPMLSSIVAGYDRLRVGMVLYRDYMEDYLTHRFDFQDDLSFIQRAMDTIRVAGGRDIPEAVFEALYTSVTRYTWQADDRLVVLVGDAPPHPFARGAVTRAMVYSAAESRGVKIHTILLPH